MLASPRLRTFAIGALLIILTIIATAMVVGGGSSDPLTDHGSSTPYAVGEGGGKTVSSGGDLASAVGSGGGSRAFGGSTGTKSSAGSPSGGGGSGSVNGAVALAPAVVEPDTGSTATVPGGSSSASSSTRDSGGSDLTATRVVKNGSMSLTVIKGQVSATITKLTSMATNLGGYVGQSQTDDVAGSPTGSLTLRVPAGKFDTAIAEASKLGKQTSLTTSADDVTGKYVDLNARLHALQSTRSTYLTILSRATTIGQTLSVQQRVEDVQQQIEQLQGQLKVLRDQSSYGTLTINVSEPGSVSTVPVHHKRHGFGLAWHNSISRFNRGIQAMIGALGPLMLALIAIGILYLGGRLIQRRTRPAPTS